MTFLNSFYKFTPVMMVLLWVSFMVTQAFALGTEWQGNEGGHVRLIASSSDCPSKCSYVIGIEMELNEGWKSYWLNPGDSGLPPQFDFSGSQNLAKVELLLPLPQRDITPYETIFAYKNHVILPVRLTPQNADAPIVLKLDFNYGLCQDICIPAQFQTELSLTPDLKTGEEVNQMLHEAVAKYPELLTREKGVGVQHVRFEKQKSGLGQWWLHLTSTKNTALKDLFILGAEEWYLSPPEMIKGSEDEIVYTFQTSVPLKKNWLQRASKKDFEIFLQTSKGDFRLAIPANLSGEYKMP